MKPTGHRQWEGRRSGLGSRHPTGFFPARTTAATETTWLRKCGSKLPQTRKFLSGDAEDNERNHGTIRVGEPVVVLNGPRTVGKSTLQRAGQAPGTTGRRLR